MVPIRDRFGKVADMSGIGAISPSTAIRIIRPVANPGDGGFFRRDDKTARQAYATPGAKPVNRHSFAGDDAAFIAQAIANDNTHAVSTADGAIAYRASRDRLTNLPVGFLIARAV